MAAADGDAASAGGDEGVNRCSWSPSHRWRPSKPILAEPPHRAQRTLPALPHTPLSHAWDSAAWRLRMCLVSCVTCSPQPGQGVVLVGVAAGAGTAGGAATGAGAGTAAAAGAAAAAAAGREEDMSSSPCWCAAVEAGLGCGCCWCLLFFVVVCCLFLSVPLCSCVSPPCAWASSPFSMQVCAGLFF